MFEITSSEKTTILAKRARIRAGLKKIRQYFRLLQKEIESARERGLSDNTIKKELRKLGFKDWAVRHYV